MVLKSQLKNFIHKFIISSIVMISCLSFSAFAYIPDINSDEIFLTQGATSECTLISQVMMMRRAAVLAGDENWSDITRATVKPQAWVSGKGSKLNYTFRYSDEDGDTSFSVAKQGISGSVETKTDTLIDLLCEHPEGIVLYLTKSSSASHAVTLTAYDYDDEGQIIFNCVDPYQPECGITSLTDSQLGRSKYSGGTQSSILKNCKYVYVITDGTSECEDEELLHASADDKLSSIAESESSETDMMISEITEIPFMED